MAKTIKPIKCPQCGSVSYSDITSERKRCNHCNTAYFIDNDDIHIHHHHHQVPSNYDESKRNKVVIISIACLFLFCTLVAVIGTFSSISNNDNRISTKLVQTQVKESKYQWNEKERTLYCAKDSLPYTISLGNVSSNDENIISSQFYISIVNAETGKREILQPLGERTTRDHYFRVWDNNNLVLVTNNKQLYFFDQSLMNFQLVGDDFYHHFNELQPGFVQISPVYANYGNGLKVLANDGKTQYLYPLASKIYDEETFKRKKHLYKNETIQTAFVFSRTPITGKYKDELPQLIRYQHTNKDGYPRDSARFSWSDYGHSHFIEKKLINQWQMERSRIENYQDFTPERRYFYPFMLDFNSEQVVIAFRVVPTRESPFVIQSLDAKTAEILWSSTSDDLALTNDIKEGIWCGERFLLRTNTETLLLDDKGQKINVFINKDHSNGLKEFF